MRRRRRFFNSFFFRRECLWKCCAIYVSVRAHARLRSLLQLCSAVPFSPLVRRHSLLSISLFFPFCSSEFSRSLSLCPPTGLSRSIDAPLHISRSHVQNVTSRARARTFAHGASLFGWRAIFHPPARFLFYFASVPKNPRARKRQRVRAKLFSASRLSLTPLSFPVALIVPRTNEEYPYDKKYTLFLLAALTFSLSFIFTSTSRSLFVSPILPSISRI